MHLRHIVFAVIFGVAVAAIMPYIVGGSFVRHLFIAIPSCLVAAYMVTRRNREQGDR
ncbi:MAG: hypothetical protein WBO55_19630 [Rhizobiaceae bacterium]